MAIARLLTQKEAAELLAVSESWLEKLRWLNDPEGPPFLRIGRLIRYRESELKAWLATRPRGGDTGVRSDCLCFLQTHAFARVSM